MILDDKRLKEDQIYPVVIRVTSSRVATTISTGIRIDIQYWDKQSSSINKTHPNWQVLNQSLIEFYAKVQREILKLQDENTFSFESLKTRLTAQDSSNRSNLKISFNQFVEQVISELKDLNKSGNALIYQTAWNRFQKFTGYKKLAFTDIDYMLLEAFKTQLLKDKVKTNTISNYFRTIRAIYNRGIKAKLVDRSHYPFIDVSIKSERTQKRAIHMNDVIRLQRLALPVNSPAWHSRNYFLLSLSLIGMSFTDLVYLTPTNIKKERLIFKRRKTHKEYNIKLTPIAKSIIGLYNGKGTKYLLPTLPSTVDEDSLTAHKLIKQFIKTTNKYLKRMGEELETDLITTYVARHTWATTAKRMGYSNELIAEALGHEYGNKITNIYLDHFEASIIDEVNAKVLEALE